MTLIQDHKKIHLIGIGGCSMNGLALILKARGYEVQGSDMTTSPFTERLTELGVPVMLGHAEENLGDADLVIYSAAIKPENPERKAAKERGIPELERSEALGQISAHYKTVVGVAGCHGKTTITSMLALIAEQDALDATVHVGGFVDFLQGGTRIGSHDLFITEACEYVESFLTLHPSIAIINNLDDDHLDYFRDIDHITDAFRKYLTLLPEDGLFLGCADDFRVRGLMNEFKGRCLSYGMKDADYMPTDIEYDARGNPAFTLTFKGEPLGRIQMGVPGDYNMINAVAAAAAALALGAPFERVAGALGDYQLTRRRFEHYGESRGVNYIHDFAHHPGEIRAVMQAASRYPHEKLYVVFQCNSYT
ncbi:MAG: UDP-N-acetylmuramate--L-alanine ligase, partial [Clostridia bacterium]|nr:UDP-N-acetylmuramate--L-alanine ligase [Clostridia bacterium]